MRLRREEKIRLGKVPQPRRCKVCGIIVGKGKSYCSDECKPSGYKSIKSPYCIECGVKEKKKRCESCERKRVRKYNRKYGRKRRGNGFICEVEGCRKHKHHNKNKYCWRHSDEGKQQIENERKVYCMECGEYLGRKKFIGKRKLHVECKKQREKRHKRESNKVKYNIRKRRELEKKLQQLNITNLSPRENELLIETFMTKPNNKLNLQGLIKDKGLFSSVLSTINEWVKLKVVEVSR